MRIDSQKALSIADQIFFGARNFIISACVVKWFGAESFGYYVLLMTLTTLIVRVHSGLINLPFGAHDTADISGFNKYLARHFLIYIAVALVAAIIYVFSFPYQITYS